MFPNRNFIPDFDNLYSAKNETSHRKLNAFGFALLCNPNWFFLCILGLHRGTQLNCLNQ